MLPKGLKLIGLSAITCIDKEGKTKKITAKKYPDLFKRMTATIKKAEKEGKVLWAENRISAGRKKAKDI
jgi:hypothetical protein